MRTRALIVLAAAALALSGCGAHNLVLKVDVLSYLDAAQKTVVVGSLAPGSYPEPVVIVDNMAVNLIEGLNDAAEVKSVTFSLGGQVTSTSGSGSCRLRFYLSEEGTDPLTTAPVMDVPVHFSAAEPGVVDTVATGSPEVARLFMQKNLHLSVAIDGITIDSPVTDLTMTIGRFEAVVIAGRKAF